MGDWLLLFRQFVVLLAAVTVLVATACLSTVGSVALWHVVYFVPFVVLFGLLILLSADFSPGYESRGELDGLLSLKRSGALLRHATRIRASRGGHES